MHIELTSAWLRRPEPEDAGRMYAYRNDPEVVSGLGGFVPGMARGDLDDWIQRHRKRDDEVVWVIADRDDNACLGHVGLYQIDYRVGKAELAVCIGDKSWWEKGLGKEAARATIEFGFRELNLNVIRLYVLDTNRRARRLYESLGFRHDGRLRCDQFREGRYVDSLVMSLLRSEFLENSKQASDE